MDVEHEPGLSGPGVDFPEVHRSVPQHEEYVPAAIKAMEQGTRTSKLHTVEERFGATTMPTVGQEPFRGNVSSKKSRTRMEENVCRAFL